METVMLMVTLGVWIAISAVLFLRMEYKLLAIQSNYRELNTKLDAVIITLSHIAMDVKAIAAAGKQKGQTDERT